ncbi:DUF3800 domain-containing protein [Xanthomonas campestris pv. campestris]|uniref:DUF3800 domain-containing protein n=1 Tax=Xanthomonas campestris TaxID=339 RepID=UPI00265BE5D1|nr:DUF3800 domain-containing protein [Xanthomonas campestris]MDO0791808.1 DUF3800 domain-containing protein [Xanthomonas campestris pv. campestris]
MHYLVYLDEFGHIGPYVGPNDPKYSTHPAFGVAGLALPADKVRAFTSFFFTLKNKLLAYEVQKSGKHPAHWEKKGGSLFTLTNVEKYRELRAATYRIFNRIKQDGGFIFYVGIEKDQSPDTSNAKGLYKAVMHEAIKRLDSEFRGQKSQFMILLDQQDDMQQAGSSTSMRHEIVCSAALSMFGAEKRRTLIEPPMQAESHLYQSLQCADWICGLVGRLVRYEIEPNVVPTHFAFEKYFAARLRQVSRRSSIRKKPQIVPADLLED